MRWFRPTKRRLVGGTLALLVLGSGWAWSVSRGGPPPRLAVTLPPESWLVGYSADGRSFRTRQTQQGLASWDLATGQRVALDSRADLRLVTPAPDGKHALGVRIDSGAAPTLVDFEMATVATRSTWPIPTGRLTGISFVAWGDDDRSCRTITNRYLGGDVEVATWDLATGQVQFRLVAGPGLPHVGPSAFAPDGLTWVLYDRQADAWQLWDGRRDRPIHGPLPGSLPRRNLKHANVPAAQFSRDGRTLLTNTDHGAVDVWDVTSGRRTRSIPIHPVGHLVSQIDLSPDGRLLATTAGIMYDRSFPSQVNLWISQAIARSRRLTMSQEVVISNLATDQPVARYPVAQWGGFAPNGRTVVTFDTRVTLAIRDAPKAPALLSEPQR